MTIDLDQALHAHTDWKIRLRWALTERIPIDEAAVSATDRCELARCLAGEMSARFGRLGSYAECTHAHRRFHLEAGRIARLINAGEYAEAERLLDPGAAYSAASRDLVRAIVRLRQHTADVRAWRPRAAR